MQEVDLRNKNHKQFLVKNKKGAITKKIISDLFFQLILKKKLVFFFVKSLNIISSDRSKNYTHFTRKNCKV